jgi:hypothetical protein
MKRLRQDFFADAALAGDEYRDPARRDALDGGDRFTHLGVARDDAEAKRAAVEIRKALQGLDARLGAGGLGLGFKARSLSTWRLAWVRPRRS